MAKAICTVDLVAQSTECAHPPDTGTARGGTSRLLIENSLWIRTGTPTYTAADSTISVPVRFVNIQWDVLGSRDGMEVTGVKLFLPTPPTPVGVTPRNPTGYMSFTGPNQPYWHYAEMVWVGQYSSWKNFQFRVPPGTTRIQFTVHMLTVVPGEPDVPEMAPDTLPAGLHDSTNVILDSPHFGLSRRILKGIVVLRFTPQATRDERQAAVESIGGRVVGGRRVPGLDGYYYVRITDDGTGLQTRAAVDALSERPSVATANPEYMWLPEEWATYAEPDEGGGDWRAPWRTNPSLANGDNWGLEAIAAPHAWGCSTGSPLVKVGVIDLGFHSHPDLMPNISHAPALDAYSGLSYVDDYHGNSVASVIGARGNNGQGITGVMWNADLRLYDLSVYDNGERKTVPFLKLWKIPVPVKELMERRLLQAIAGGADVINISMAVPPHVTNAYPESDRRREIERFAADLAAVVSAQPNKPLIVIGAGNFNRDAYWSVFPVLARLLPQQVIVVSAVESVADDFAPLWSGPNGAGTDYNSSSIGQQLVQIAAPGESIGVLTAGGRTEKSGTSLSAPMVSGVAGLLKSFDRRLTAPEIKALLIEGATRGRRRVPMDGNVYVANAYHSLIAAAERNGAPLCGGMPVWRDEEFGLVQGRRLVGTGTGTLASLFTQSGSDLVPLHGESTIRVDQQYYGWFDGTWAPYPSVRTDLIGNATNRSKLGQSHDGDSVATVSRIEVSDTQEMYQVFVNGQLLASVPSTWAKKPSSQVCVVYHRTNSGCEAEVTMWKDRITTHPVVAYSPRGTEIVLAISRQQSTQFSTGTPQTCLTVYYCTDYGTTITTLAGELVFIGIDDGQIRERRSGPVRHVKQLGYSEDGQRLVFGTEFTYYDIQHTTSTGESFGVNTWYCQAQYTTRGGQSLFTLPLKRQVANCYTTATFSP